MAAARRPHTCDRTPAPQDRIHEAVADAMHRVRGHAHANQTRDKATRLHRARTDTCPYESN